MAQEIYHRSEWGNPNEQWGNVYLNADLTNELYKRASEYENSWVTDQLLNGVGTKPSIIMTPTAYEDGKLLSVKPASSINIETDFTTSNNWSWDGSILSANPATGNTVIYDDIFIENKTFVLTFKVLSYTSGSLGYRFGGGALNFNYFNSELIEGNIITLEVQSDATVGNFQFLTTDFNGSLSDISFVQLPLGDFDFTRGSSATRVNEKGLIQDVQILSDELVQNGNFEEIGSELVTNGDFATNSDWILENGAIINNGSVNIIGVGSRFRQDVLTVGKSYKLQYEVVSTNGASFRFQDGVTAFTDINQTIGYHTYYFKATGIRTQFQALGDIDARIDNVSVKEVGQNWIILSPWIVGDNVLSIDGSQVGNQYASQIIPSLTSGNKYKLQYTVSNITAGQFRINVANTLGTYVSSNGTYEFVFNASSGTSLQLQASTTLSASVSNISLIEITDDTDLPRINYTNFDYENGEVVPYSGEGSLLLEPQSTNLITQSELFSDASWRRVGSITTTDNYTTSPSGQNNATRLQWTNATNYIYQSLSHVGSNFTLSIYLKSNTDVSQNVRLFMDNGYQAQDVVVTTQWQRFEFTNTTSPTQSNRNVGLIKSGGQVGDLDISIWGAQFEELSYATSYIPTEGSIKTRLADICNNAGSSDLINSTEGVLYAEIAALVTASGSDMNIQLNDGVLNNNSINILYQNSSAVFFQKYANGVRTTNVSTSSIVKTDFNKIAIRYNATQVNVFLNGVNILNNADTNAFSILLNNLSFNRADNTKQFQGNVKCVAVFKEALSDEELQKLTQV